MASNANDAKRGNGALIKPISSCGVTPLSSESTSFRLSKKLDVNRRHIEEALGKSADVNYRILHWGSPRSVDVLVVSISGLSDPTFASEQVVKPMRASAGPVRLSRANAYTIIRESLTTASKVEEVDTLDPILTAVIDGDVALIVDGSDRALLVGASSPPTRGVQEPESEALVRGPREGFNETLQTNLSLIRRRVRTTDLRFIDMTIGSVSRTPVIVAYIEGKADPSLLDETLERMQNIQLESVPDTGFIEENISDQKIMLYPTIITTERPDKIAAGLLEGRIAIIADGTPFALLLPATLWDFLISPEDYYENHLLATFLRWIRLAAFVAALLLPSLYVAITSFHQEMIPTTLAFRIAAGREGTALPAVVEVILLEIQFEILREAGLRIPRKIGTAVSIVGVLVIGQALVAAGIVSPILITVVAGTAVASFAVPLFSISAPSRLLKFPITILAGTLGIFGVSIGVTLVFAHLATLKSFGHPYLNPIAPLRRNILWDSILIRAPLWVKKRLEQSES